MLCDNCKKEIRKGNFLELANQGFTNKELSSILKISFSTVCSWKRKFRNQGFIIKGKSGRPFKKLSTCDTCI
jgi:transposase